MDLHWVDRPLTLALTVSPLERQLMMCGRRDVCIDRVMKTQ